jgi:hypothetical protein
MTFCETWLPRPRHDQSTRNARHELDALEDGVLFRERDTKPTWCEN